MVRQVAQYAFGGDHHVSRGASHRTTEHAYRVSDVGASRMPCDLARRAASTRRGRSSAAGVTQSASVAMSTLRRSETGPSSSTFQRDERAVVKEEYKESGPSSE
eukprot:2843459-Pleurochrysis_carterae.AAC.3